MIQNFLKLIVASVNTTVFTKYIIIDIQVLDNDTIIRWSKTSDNTVVYIHKFQNLVILHKSQVWLGPWANIIEHMVSAYSDKVITVPRHLILDTGDTLGILVKNVPQVPHACSKSQLKCRDKVVCLSNCGQMWNDGKSFYAK